MTDCFVLVFILFQSEEPHQTPNLSPVVLPCLRMLQWNPAKVDSELLRAVVVGGGGGKMMVAELFV